MEKFLKKHPNRVPVYVHVDEKTLYMERHKFLVPRGLSVAEFTRVIRGRTKIRPCDAIFMFVGTKKTLPPNGALFEDLYKEHRGNDQMLHVTYTVENTFG